MAKGKKRYDSTLIGLGGLFLLAQILALLITQPFNEIGMTAFENPSDPTNILYYIIIILMFTALILVIARMGKEILIRGLILLVFTITMFYIFSSLLTIFSDSPPVTLLGGIAISGIFFVLLVVYPEWYIIDTCGIIIAAGIIAIFGISLTVPLAILLLIILAVYDAISVYKTKHMIDLGDTVLKTHLPLLIVVPKKLDYSFRKEKRFSGKKNAIFMGLGDFIIPGILAASSFHFENNLAMALTTIGGAVAGLMMLLVLAEKGKPHAGLPWLNGGAIGGYLLFLAATGGF